MKKSQPRMHPAKLGVLGFALWVLLQVAGAEADEEASPEGDDASSEPSCSLYTTKGPRGGRLELRGEHLGRTPLVLIGGRVAPILQRRKTLIAAQIHRDSDGGRVSIKAAGVQVECGTLTIVGKN